MWISLLVVLCGLGVVFSAKEDGKMGKSKSKSLVYSSHPGRLAVQYLELKDMFVEAQKMHRELVVVQSKDENTGEVSYNLCDVFDLPGRVSCVKHMKMKCDKEKTNKTEASIETAEESEKADKKKKVVFHCDPALEVDNAERVASKVDLIPVLYDLRLNAQRYEEIEYIQSVLGYAAKESKILRPYIVVYWEQAAAVVGTCKQNSPDAECAPFLQAVKALLLTTAPHCAPVSAVTDQASKLPTSCYIAGATHATAREAGYLLDQGLLSFRGAWLQHHKNPATGVYDESALMPVNAVSMEVMEWGVMMGAEKFVAVVVDSLTALSAQPGADTSSQGDGVKRKAAADVILLTSLVEHERAKDGKSYCLSHKAGANQLKTSPVAVDISWCGRLKDRHFVYTPRNSATDDGPFENPTLNKFVVRLALYLLNVFSSRLLQLLLGGMCVVVVLGVMRFCFLRWRRATNKTF